MEDLVTRLLDGNLNAAPRILTLLEKGDPQADDIMQRIARNATGAHRIGITGPPGAGKSTLVEAMTAELRKQDLTVGVLVVDPSSPFTGGAILGDRVRMRDHFLDPGVFIRSMATRGASGGLSAIAPLRNARPGRRGRGRHHRGDGGRRPDRAGHHAHRR